MRRTLITKIFLIIVGASMLLTGVGGFFAPPAQAAIIDRIVAHINEDIVTFHELRQAATPYLLQQGMSPEILEDRSKRDGILKEVLEELIDRRLLLQEAEKLDLRIAEEEIDQWLAYTRQQQGMSEADFRAMIEQYGIDYKSYREVIRENLLKIRMVNVRVGSQVNISENEVDAEYRKRFGQSELDMYITVSHILFPPESNSPEHVTAAREKAEAVRARLEAGEDFAEVARAESEGPGADKGGSLGTFKRGQLDGEFERVAFEIPVGEMSGVVQTRFGFHIIKVTEVEERGSADLIQRKAQLRAELQQAAVERQLEIYIQNLRNRAFVKVSY
ncbi:MAG: peptidylprolyl isomerase [Bradymonadaceae bacterium]